ncbi:sulfotransferase [Pararhizobium haloflavum]|uniref:sulfotransferase n=1 Tax=Pararhizobium haloflavum TaxID=2037914 RepID=UPI000C17A5CB|nr:sulfotransferase [Pararhizobium haloflavum]
MTAYGSTSRLAHRLALANPAIAEAAFDMERLAVGRNVPPASPNGHVFVTGLARAGTTILMRALHTTGAFASLTYRHMPFVLAPKLWGSVSRRFVSSSAPTLRAHGDRIMIDTDSPEALDEVFWRVNAGTDYIGGDALVPHAVDDETMDRFAAYVGLVLHAEQRSRYLTKNNNNILRLGALLDRFTGSDFLVPFREPVQHALSLRKQHHHHCAIQSADPFVRDYMTWLAHHEFGLDHRPFRFGHAGQTTGDPAELNYWLRHWIAYHDHLLSHHADRPSLTLVCYEDLCADPGVWAGLTHRLDLKCDALPAFQIAAPHPADEIDPVLEDRAQRLYERMRMLARAAHGSS